MAGNRFTQVTGSTFQPLDLNEIMMVPLYKQKQENDAMLALDEFSKLEANSLDADKEYVAGQISAFQNESSKLSAEILERGVDRNLVNKVRDLRNRKNQELSIQGKTGQASAAFNQYQANKKQIMDRKDLTDQQKILGLQRAQEQYKGVLEDDVYEDYAGASFVDVMKRGRDILKEITPQEKAKILGMDLNADGSYNDGIYIHETLKPEHIQKIVKQALQGDDAAMNYLREVESLGLGNVEDMLNASAVSAGNIGQVDIQKGIKFIPKTSRATANDKKARINPGQNWSKQILYSGEGAFNKSLEIDEEFIDEKGFNADGSLPKFEKFEGQKIKPGFWGANSYHEPSETWEFRQWKKDKSRGFKVQETIQKLRQDNPLAFTGKTDKEVYDTFIDARKQAAQAYSEVIKPMNVKNSFYQYGEKIIGSGERPGDFVSTRGIKILGQTGVDKQVKASTIASQLGYDDVQEFEEVVRTKGTLMGMLPGDPDFPMGPVIQIPAQDEDDGFVTLVMSPDQNIKETYPDASVMMKNLVNGTSYSEGMGSYVDPQTNTRMPYYKYYVTQINPRTGKYEPRMIRSTHKYTKAQVDAMEFETDQYGRNTGNVIIDGQRYNNTEIKTYRDVVQTAIDGVTSMFDNTKTTN